MIRLATLQDTPQLKGLMIKLLQHHEEFNNLYEIDESHQNEILHFFNTIQSHKNIKVFVAEIESELAGYIICSKHIRPNYFALKSKGRIDSLYVNSSFRNQNLASKLVEEALRFLKEETYIELEFTAENQLARSFWLNKGFQILNHQCMLKLK